MSIPTQLLQSVEHFFAAVASKAKAYENSSFSYVAVKRGDSLLLIRGVLLLSNAPLPLKEFSSENVRAARCRLDDVAPSPRAFVKQLLQGQVSAPGCDVIFPAAAPGSYMANYVPFHQAGLQAQHRAQGLTIIGAEHRLEGDLLALDWELKAASVPYDTLNELLTDFGLGPLQGNLTAVDLLAVSVAAVDASSEVGQDHAKIRARLANGLRTSKFTLGYRTLRRGQVAERKRLQGRDFEWTVDGSSQLGTATIEIEEGDVLQCTASYDGVAQHFYWLADVSKTQNARRAAYEAFDPRLEQLKAIIAASAARGRDARELEAAVSWILWMLGFSVLHLGGISRMQDAADLLVTTPLGHFGVIECTTGLLKAENKLALLHERAQAVRRTLDASGSRHLRILTAIVTSKPRSDVEVDIEQAERLGIFVATREYLDRAVERTLIPQNADQLFAEAEAVVKLALATRAPMLPGIPGV
jgi:hypothetical protein